jgi:Ca2+-transporting ATPase
VVAFKEEIAMRNAAQQATWRPEEEKPTRPWHTLTAEEVCARLGTDRLSGLSEQEARQRLAQYGPNRLRQEEKDSILEVFLEEIREPMVLLLLVTGALYTLWGGLTDALTIFFVILTLAGIEVFNEWRAEEALAALRKMAEPTALVRRGERSVEVPLEQVVPGDMILLRAGRRVPADARILEGYGLAVDESSLTGESVPIDKDPDLTLSESTALAERRNLAFAGTTVTRGRGTALVVATGMASELGRVAQLATEVESPRTPLQQAMRELSGSLVWLALGFSVIVPLLGWLLTDQSVQDLILTGLSLAFATIPEEMPIIITMVLSLGAYRLSQRRAVVKELKAVETLGAVTVIATDKTGTLTENRMQVSRLYPAGMEHRLLEIGALCSDAAENGGQLAGDPLEMALLRAAQQAGLDLVGLRRSLPLRDEFTFNNVRKMMSTVYHQGGQLWVVAKGAPEVVLARSTWRRTEAGEEPLSEAGRQVALEQAARMAAEGLRVIGCAEAHLPCGGKMVTDGRLARDEAESDLTLVGLVGFADPPRPEVREAIVACRTAGIRPIMITGDHPLTARVIAAQVGLEGNGPMLTGPDLDALSDHALQEAVDHVSLYARTSPEHKLRIVRALQQRGERVAVTADGINDAPALVAAHIGVAMGERGTDVARAAGDMVLADDNFATIVRAIEEGRVLFANLKKGVRYYLACKVALVSATLLPTLLGVPVPFAPIQIILMELFMDLAAAATFVAEPGEADLMRRPPRAPRARFMDRAMVVSIFGSAAGLFAAVSVAYLVALWAEPQGGAWYSAASLVGARTAAFVTWLLGHVLLALNMRSEREPLFQLGLFSNRLMVIWGAATVAFVLLVTCVPGVQAAVKTVALSGREWALAVGSALAGTFWTEIRKWLQGEHPRQVSASSTG